MAEGGKVKKQLRDKWVKALRSGKYKQGTAWLRKHEQHCCLGVLCEVAGYTNISNARTMDARGLRKLRDDCGLGTQRTGLQKSLIKLNDDEDASFKRIASWIERNIPVTK